MIPDDMMIVGNITIHLKIGGTVWKINQSVPVAYLTQIVIDSSWQIRLIQNYWFSREKD